MRPSSLPQPFTMRSAQLILMSILAAVAVAGDGCDRPSSSGKTTSKGNAPKKEWTAEEIAHDPQGYLLWSDKQVAEQIAQRESKLTALAERRGQFEEKQRILAENISAIENVRVRLATAYQQAEDEDRWPIPFAGRKIERQKAIALLQQTKDYVEERKPLQTTYAQMFEKLDAMKGSLEKDVADLKRLRDKLALDLETVRLDQSKAEVDKLRKTETQLASMASAVTTMNNDPLSIQAPTEPPGKVNIDDLLK